MLKEDKELLIHILRNELDYNKCVVLNEFGPHIADAASDVERCERLLEEFGAPEPDYTKQPIWATHTGEWSTHSFWVGDDGYLLIDNDKNPNGNMIEFKSWQAIERNEFVNLRKLGA